MDKRASGILLHITSLPSDFGIGDLGPAAYRFADFLAAAGQRYWQVLPLNYTHQSHANSPYSSVSAFAGNTIMISPELLVQEGLLTDAEIEPLRQFPAARVDYSHVIAAKTRLFTKAFQRFRKTGDRVAYEAFCAQHAAWLDDFALFLALRAHFRGKVWNLWPEELRDRRPDALAAAAAQFGEYIEREKFLQYVFYRQWFTLKEYCSRKKIGFVGDVPIYVDMNSADVWSNPSFFKLDGQKKPFFVAGVPPDYFSATGQLWGNPVYDWDRLKADRYGWWADRLRHNFTLFETVRIDHFRGFAAYWEVPAGEKTAIPGRWVPAPGEEFFTALKAGFPSLPIIAEDLGVITPDVRQLIARFGLPGMKVLLFAFGDDFPAGSYLPHNHVRNCIVYTGTHDNNTVRGWFEKEAGAAEKDRLSRYAGKPVNAHNVHHIFMELAMLSVANTVIFPLQDVLGLDASCRMNLPGTAKGNWEWRLLKGQLTDAIARDLLAISQTYQRVAEP